MKATIKTNLSRLTGGILICAAAFAFTACENFLSGDDIKEQIETEIAYNNAKTVNISISCKEEMGTIFPQQSYQARVGFAFEVQFIPNLDNYIIRDPATILQAVSRIDPTQSRADCVSFKAVEQSFEDKNAGMYRVKVTIQKNVDDIMIQPDCTQLPRIQEIYPPYTPGGYDQDTTVRITFNKEMNPESFGSFDCISIKKGAVDLGDYYSTPYFTNDNTVLNIPTVKEKNILGENSESLADITLYVDVSNLLDVEGYSVPQFTSYTYRINKAVDNQKPVITEFELKTTQNTNSPLYKTLTSKDFKDWNNTESNSFKYGDYSQNHVSDTVYFELTGYDKHSGINSIKISETYYKTVGNLTTTEPIIMDNYGQNNLVYISKDSEDNELFSLSLEYKLKTFNDGIIKLVFQLEDNATNLSVEKTYYVIKDTYIDSNNFMFEENNGYANNLPYQEEVYNSLIRHVDNTDDKVCFTPKETAKDTFFLNYATKYSYEIKWGYSEDAMNNSASFQNGQYRFTRDSKRMIYLDIIFGDEVGNKKSFTTILLPQPEGLSSVIEVEGPSSQYYKFRYLKDCNDETYKSFVPSLGSFEFGYLYICQKNNEASIVKRDYVDSSGLGGNSIYSNCTYKIWICSYVMLKDAGTNDIENPNFWYSPISDEYCEVKFDSNGHARSSDIKIVRPESNVVNTYDTYEPYMRDGINVYTEAIHSSGCYKVTLDNYKAESLAPAANVRYTFKCKADGDSNFQTFYTPTFYLSTKKTYQIFVEALDSQGNLYQPPYSDFYLNPDQNPNLDPSNDRLEELQLTEDLLPPKELFLNHQVSLDTADYWICEDMPEDDDAGVGIYENSEGKGEITYCFIPSSSSTTKFGEKYTIEEIKSYEKKKYIYDLSDEEIRIPLDGIQDGFYTICLILRDNNENYSITCAPAYRRIHRESINWSMTKDSGDLKINITYNQPDYDWAEAYIFSDTDEKWESKSRHQILNGKNYINLILQVNG